MSMGSQMSDKDHVAEMLSFAVLCVFMLKTTSRVLFVHYSNIGLEECNHTARLLSKYSKSILDGPSSSYTFSQTG